MPCDQNAFLKIFYVFERGLIELLTMYRKMDNQKYHSVSTFSDVLRQMYAMIMVCEKMNHMIRRQIQDSIYKRYTAKTGQFPKIHRPDL